MPVSPAVADQYATTAEGEPTEDSIPAEYAALVAALLALLAGALAPPAAGVSWATWATVAMARLPGFQRDILARLSGLDVTGLATRAVAGVTATAAREAASDVRWDGALPGTSTYRVGLLVEALRASHARISTVLSQTYRRAVEQAWSSSPAVLVQRELDALANAGITGYVDSAGRNWSLEHYVEVVVRSHLADAAFSAYTQVLTQAGVRFARVLPAGVGCKRCLPWAGRVVSIDSTPAGTYTATDHLGRSRVVAVAGSLQEARQAGVFHPWCQHRLSPWVARQRRSLIPVPRIDRVARAEARYRHRTARAWDRRTRVALTAQARQHAQTRARTWRRPRGG